MVIMSENEFLEFAESQFVSQNVFEFDLGMALSALQNMLDEPENWSEFEYDWFMNKTDELLERFSAKYPDWMDEYSRRKTLEDQGEIDD